LQDHCCLQITEEESAKLGRYTAVIKICLWQKCCSTCHVLWYYWR